MRDLERLLGRKTMEVEILKEALDLARAKKPTLLLPSQDGRPRTVRDENGCRQELWLEAAMAGKVEEARVEAVLSTPIAVPLDHDRAHVVVEHLARHPVKGGESVLVGSDLCLDPLVP